MEKYTDIKIYKIFVFLYIKWKTILLSGFIFGILVSLSYFLSYNSLDKYFPNAMTEASILSKIERTNEEIDYYKKILNNNKKYRENSIYFSYNNSGATLYDVEIFLLDASQVELNEIILELNSDQFYENIGEDLELGVDSKYVRELFSFSSTDNKKIDMKITLLKNEDLKKYTDAVFKNLKSYDFNSGNYQIDQISTSSITEKDLKEYYMDFFESDSTTNASIIDREQELKLYDGYLNQVNDKLHANDYVKMLIFSSFYVICLICLVFTLLYIKNNIPLTKEDYEKEGIVFVENKISRNDILKLTSFELLILLFRREKVDRLKGVMIPPGIIAKQSLISFYNNNPNLNYIYYGDYSHEE